jgi:hypothetical protein
MRPQCQRSLLKKSPMFRTIGSCNGIPTRPRPKRSQNDPVRFAGSGGEA